MHDQPHQNIPQLPRRGFLAAGGALTGAFIAGCDVWSTSPADDAEGSSDSKGPEAPSLEQAVQSGDLPPVEERLPNQPVVVDPLEQVGDYGGEWHSAVLGVADAAYIYCVTHYENLVRWSMDWTGATGDQEIEPNVAESYEVNTDATRFTFHLRPGMKWSDGAPFSADDIVFGIEDVLLNEDLNPVPPAFLVSEGQPATVDKVDDHTVTITFPRPAGLFLQRLATPDLHVITHFPLHYLREFHQRYNPDVEELAEDEGFADWAEYFNSKGAPWNWGTNPDNPTLGAWKLNSSFDDGTRVTLDRNAYYWKVDPDGSQLPYIDQVIFNVVQDVETLVLQATSGDITVEAGPDTRFTSLENKPVLARDRDAGDYEFVDVRPTSMNVMVICLNLTTESEVHREVFRNKDFRLGLSHAINRNEIIESTMQGQGEPYQAAPLPDSPFYDEEFATQHLEYDVTLANHHLDLAGFTERDSEGFRLGPGGDSISINLGYVAEFQPEWAEMLELLKRYWAEVGVNLQPSVEGRSLFGERTDANQHQATVWTGAGGLDVVLDARYYLPYNGGSYFAIPWMKWYNSDGQEGMEPPAATRQQMELYDELEGTGDAATQTDLMRQILQIAKDEFYVIGIARQTQEYFIKSNQLRNVPEELTKGWTYPTPGPTWTCQYFLQA